MKRRGFTLIELLVVVGIIVILVAILVPALGHAKVVAQKASTSALLSQLQGDIGQYYATFNAYPGPGSVADTTGKGGTKQLSGAQNMLLGLSYAFYPSPPATPPPGTPASLTLSNPSSSSTVIVYPSSATGPINYAAPNILNPTQGQQLSPFFTVTAKNTALSPAGNKLFPVVMDTFTDPLPVLYYRRTPGIDTPSNLNTTPSAYYEEENHEYTSGSITSPTGAVFQQPGFNQLYLCGTAGIAVNSGANGVGATVRGGYILMSAGPSRVYGMPGGTKPSDNIVVIGGD